MPAGHFWERHTPLHITAFERGVGRGLPELDTIAGGVSSERLRIRSRNEWRET